MTKKAVSVFLAAVISTSMAMPTVMAEEAADTTQVYDYENKYLWTVPTDSFTWDDYSSLYDHHKGMGDTAYDGTEFSIDDLINSPLGESMVENISNFLLYPDETDPAVYAYWEDLGIKKELHDADDPDRKWSVFTPLEAYEEENADKKYPVLFVFHGNNNPIYLIESWGYAQLCAEEEFICVMPWAKNGGKSEDPEQEGVFLDEEMDRILEILRSDYPIDESRMYATGFSLGGRSTVLQTLHYPNMFAAIGVGGQHLAGVSGQSTIEEEKWEALKETPVIQMAGMNDRNHHFPYGQKGETQIDSLNRWFDINGIDWEFTQEECLEIADTSEDIAERKLGLKSDDTYIQYYDGTEYYTADYYNEDDVNMMKIIAIEGMPHWLTGSFPRIVWNFLKQYARDTETGELIVLNQDNEPQTEPQEVDYNKKGSFVGEFSTEAKVKEEITIHVKASDDITEYQLKDEDGEAIEIISVDKTEGENGYYNWVISTSLDEAGSRIISLVPINAEGQEQNTIKLPVKVEE